MRIRIRSSIIGCILIIALMFASSYCPLIMTLTLGIVSALCTYEVLSVKKLQKSLLSIPCYIFSIINPLLITTEYFYFAFVGLLYVALSLMVLCHKKVKFEDTMFSLMMVTIISFSLSAIVKTYSFDYNNLSFYLVLMLGVPWCADTGAYFVGSAFGKHKLCPEISPKKTTEGVLGGFLGGFIGITIILLVYKFIIFPIYNVNFEYNYLLIYFYTLIAIPISIIGDLTFSILKRNFGVKDYGSIIPGHGGLLDRLDSVIFAAPLLFILACFFPILTV